MANFSQEIQDFQRYGTYQYEFDAAGTLTFNSSSNKFSQVYLSFNLQNTKYNNDKIQSFYTNKFNEFIPTEESNTSIPEQNNNNTEFSVLEEENVLLKQKLDLLTGQLDNSTVISDNLAIKQVILELRKLLGQGRVDSDFSLDFPYSPIRKEIR